MDDMLQQYLDLLSQGRANEASPALLRQLRQRYPYFSTPEINLAERLKAEGLSDDDIRSLQASIALRTSVPEATSSLPGIQSDEEFYGEKSAARTKMTTDSTIDSFLEHYGNSADNDKEVALLEKLIFNPVAPDYTASLEALAPAESDTTASAPDSDNSSRQDRLIDAFIAKSAEGSSLSDAIDLTPDTADTTTPASVPDSQPALPDVSDSHQNALLTESLAKIYIKKGRYAKAFEIIHSLSLNYPEKSCYFADQLRFLHKLMLIQDLQHKTKK